MTDILKDVFNEAIPLLEKTAPTIAAILTSVSATSGSVIIPLLAQAFESDPTNLPGLVSGILNNPQAESKLAGVEQAFVAHMLKIL